VKGDRRRRASSTTEAPLDLTWRDSLAGFDRSLDGARALTSALGVPSTDAALQACALVASAMGAATAPLLDPRLGIDLMRLHHAFDDVVLSGAPALAHHKGHAVARVIERRRVGESALTVVECAIEGRATWRAGFLSRGPRRAHKDAIDADFSRDVADGARLAGSPARAHERLRLIDDARFLAARATGDHDPLVVDDRAAENAGLPRAVVPPRALALIAWCTLSRAGVDLPLRLRATHARTVAWGDEITAQVSSDGRACELVDDEGALLTSARVERA